MTRKKNLSIKIDPEKYNQLEKIAKLEGITLSKLGEKMIDGYLLFFHDFNRLRLIGLPRPLVIELYANLDKKKIQDVIDVGILQAMNLLKTELPVLSFENVTCYIKHWFFNNSITFHVHPLDDKRIKYTCRHGLGNNWALVTIEIVCELLRKVNCKIEEKEYDEHIFEITFDSPRNYPKNT